MANIKDKKGIVVTSPFKLLSGVPLDGRVSVETIEERDSIVSSHAAYEGLLVYVKEQKSLYLYQGAEWVKQITANQVDEDLYEEVTTKPESETNPFFDNLTEDLTAAFDGGYSNSAYSVAQQHCKGYGGLIGIPPKGSFKVIDLYHYFESTSDNGHMGYTVEVFAITPPVKFNFGGTYMSPQVNNISQWAELVSTANLGTFDGQLSGWQLLRATLPEEIITDGKTAYFVMIKAEEEMNVHWVSPIEGKGYQIAQMYQSDFSKLKSIYCGRLVYRTDGNIGNFVTTCTAKDYDSWSTEHTTQNNFFFLPARLYSVIETASVTYHGISTNAGGKFTEKVGKALQSAESIIPLKSLADAVKKETWSRDIIEVSWVAGKYVNFSSGLLGQNDVYFCTESYVPVEPGNTIRMFYKKQKIRINHLAFYDEDKNYLSGSKTMCDSILIPDDARFVRFSCYTVDLGDTTLEQAAQDLEVIIQESVQYTPRTLLKTEYKLPASVVQMDSDSIPAKAITPDKLSFATRYTSKNIFNEKDPDILMGYYAGASGIPAVNASYNLTGYCPVTPGKIITQWLLGSSGYSKCSTRFIAWYGSNKQSLGTAEQNVTSAVVPQGAAFARISLQSTRWSPSTPMSVIIQQSDSENFAEIREFGDYYLISKKALDIDFDTIGKESFHIYLPPEICVASGRTIELYNRQVCLESPDYIVQWIGNYGRQYERKYVIEGNTSLAGQSFLLTFNLYNTDLKLLATAKTTVKFVSSTIDTEQLIIPIGDSLTNNKAWISEVKTLSSGMILWRGTRGTKDPTLVNGITHEGRSGAGTGWYNVGTSKYTFDDNGLSTLASSGSLDGITDANGAVITPVAANPFWNKTAGEFDFDFYCNSKAEGGAGYFKNSIGEEISLTPTGVQIYLGTNGLNLDPTNGCTNIRTLVDNIRNSTKGATIPIYVVNTLHRPDQIFTVTADGFSTNTAGEYKFLADVKIQNLEKALYEALKNYENVFFVPVAVTHDSEYNFPFVEDSVNPRLTTIKVKKYTDCTHPSKAGYEQMADIMFSTIAAHYKDNQ